MERKFLADCMLGKLARWLRVMGCDVEYFPAMADAELAERAVAEGRLILTRDTLLIRRRKARDNHFFVEGDDYRDQLRQVVKAFAIDPFRRFLTRCLECNALLEETARGPVEGRVPPYVFATQETFRSCPSCGRLYWGATHRDRMLQQLGEITATPLPSQKAT